MAGQRSSFGKLQRDRDKKAKAAAKRVRRQEGPDAVEEADSDVVVGAGVSSEGSREPSTADLLDRIAEIHQQFDAGVISYEQFEETKADLMSRLSVD